MFFRIKYFHSKTGRKIMLLKKDGFWSRNYLSLFTAVILTIFWSIWYLINRQIPPVRVDLFNGTSFVPLFARSRFCDIIIISVVWPPIISWLFGNDKYVRKDFGFFGGIYTVFCCALMAGLIGLIGKNQGQGQLAATILVAWLSWLILMEGQFGAGLLCAAVWGYTVSLIAGWFFGFIFCLPLTAMLIPGLAGKIISYIWSKKNAAAFNNGHKNSPKDLTKDLPLILQPETEEE
jgi:hypothetical protein